MEPWAQVLYSPVGIYIWHEMLWSGTEVNTKTFSGSRIQEKLSHLFLVKESFFSHWSGGPLLHVSKKTFFRSHSCLVLFRQGTKITDRKSLRKTQKSSFLHCNPKKQLTRWNSAREWWQKEVKIFQRVSYCQNPHRRSSGIVCTSTACDSSPWYGVGPSAWAIIAKCVDYPRR